MFSSKSFDISTTYCPETDQHVTTTTPNTKRLLKNDIVNNAPRRPVELKDARTTVCALSTEHFVEIDPKATVLASLT